MPQDITLDVAATIFICLYNYMAADIDVIRAGCQQDIHN